MPSAAPRAWSHKSCARSRHAWLVSCALALSACSVYSDDMRDADGLGNDDDDTSSSGSGGTKATSAGSTGKSNGTAGKGGTPSQAGNSGSLSGGGSEPDQEPSAGQPAGGSAGTATAGSSGDSSSGGSLGGSSAGNGGGGSPATQPGDLIDGFEDEDLTLEQTSGRGGVWYLFDDASVGKVGPAPLVCSPLSAAPVALGGYAMHITATGFTGFGSGLGVDFRAGKKVYDASQHSGIRFWARVGEGKNTRHRLQLSDGTTEALGGKCNPAANAPNGEKCDDHFGVNQTFTTTWTQYSVPFAAMSQIGWGNAAAALDEATLYGLQITAKAKLEVDLWVDELEFF